LAETAGRDWVFDNSHQLTASAGQIAVYFAVTGDIMFLFQVRQAASFAVWDGCEHYLLPCYAAFL
jgi:hypothetical protein